MARLSDVLLIKHSNAQKEDMVVLGGSGGLRKKVSNGDNRDTIWQKGVNGILTKSP